MIGKWVDRAITAGWVLLGAATCALAITAMYSGSVPAPFWDHWGYTDPRDYLKHMMARHNEHPLVLGRIVFAIDYWLADARGWLLLAMIFAGLLLQVLALTGLAWLARIRRPRTLAILAAFFTIVIFSPHTWENLVWPFQAPFVASYAATAAAVVSLAFYATRRRTWILVFSFVCAVIAITALSNGLLTPLLLAAMAWHLRLPRKVWAAFVILAALAWPLFLLAPGGSAQGGSVGWKDLPTVYVYLLTYLGNVIVNPLSQWFKVGGPLFNSIHLAIALGELLLIAGLALLGRSVFKHEQNPGLVGTCVLLLFVFGTAGLTALGRAVGFPPDQALSPRYGANGAILLSCMAILALVNIPIKGRWIVRGGLGGAMLAAALVPIMSMPLIRDLTGQQRGRLSGQTAFITGVRDMDGIGQITFDADAGFAAAARMRETGKWMFQDQWSRKVGEDIASDVAALGSAPPACGGAMQLSQTPAYWRANGLVDRKWTASAKIVLLVDADKRLAGYGVVPRRASDLSPFGYNDGRQVDWQGHVLPNSRAPLSAWLASPKAIVCRIAVQG